MDGLAGKTVLITGAVRGIGRATAEEFAHAGANVVMNYKSSAQHSVQKIVHEMSDRYKVKVIAIQADVSDEAAVQAMADRIKSTFSSLDIVVNNAEIIIDKPYEEHTFADYRTIFDTNVYSVLLSGKIFGRMIQETAGQGSIINVASTAGMFDFYPDNIDYAASKAAVQSITKTLATQHAPYIRVNGVAPGWVDTDMNKDLPSDVIADAKKQILLGRIAHPRDIARVIVFLASDAAKYITGTVIPVDGGRR